MSQFFLNIKVPLEVHVSDWDEDDPERPKNRKEAAELMKKEYETNQANVGELLEVSPAEYFITEE